MAAPASYAKLFFCDFPKSSEMHKAINCAMDWATIIREKFSFSVPFSTSRLGEINRDTRNFRSLLGFPEKLYTLVHSGSKYAALKNGLAAAWAGFSVLEVGKSLETPTYFSDKTINGMQMCVGFSLAGLQVSEGVNALRRIHAGNPNPNDNRWVAMLTITRAVAGVAHGIFKAMAQETSKVVKYGNVLSGTTEIACTALHILYKREMPAW